MAAGTTLVLLLWAARARAASFPDCLHQPGGERALQDSVEDIESCQARTEKALAAKAQRARKKISAADADRLHVHQKAEIKTFLEMTGVIPAEGAVQDPDPAAAAAKSGAENPVADATRAGSLIKVSDADLQALDPGSRAAVRQLQDALNPVGPDGRVGLTPDKLKLLRRALAKTPQGDDADVEAVLTQAQNGGGRLTPDALKALLKAGLKPSDLSLDPTKAPPVPAVPDGR